MGATTRFSDPVPEGSSRRYRTVLKDADGVVIPAASISAITLTLKDVATATVVNSRTNQTVLNANGGTLEALTGVFTMVFSALDNVILGTSAYETRRATFKVTYVGGVENHEVTWPVKALADVP